MPLQAFAALLESEVLQHVFACWRRARTDWRTPAWQAIAALEDPVIAEYGWAWRLEPSRGDFVSFLMGPRPREMYGYDAVGCSVAEFYHGPIAETIETNMRQVIGGPMLHRAAGIIAWREGRADLGERMVLPIRYASDGAPDALMGATVFDYTMLGAIAPATPPVPTTEMMPLYPEEDGPSTGEALASVASAARPEPDGKARP